MTNIRYGMIVNKIQTWAKTIMNTNANFEWIITTYKPEQKNINTNVWMNLDEIQTSIKTNNITNFWMNDDKIQTWAKQIQKNWINYDEICTNLGKNKYRNKFSNELWRNTNLGKNKYRNKFLNESWQDTNLGKNNGCKHTGDDIQSNSDHNWLSLLFSWWW